LNNYYKPGPATSSSSKSRIIQPYPDDGTNIQPAGVYGKFYVAGNYMSGSLAVTNDNWLGVTPHANFSLYTPVVTLNDLKSVKEFGSSNVTTHTAETAYQKVLDYAGACLVRDAVDKRIITDVSAGIATFTNGGNGSTNGIIDTQTAVDGWPELKPLPAPTDTDGDGMPDIWEDSNGLQKNNPADALPATVDGKYPNLEVYLNSLVASIIEKQLKDGLFTSVNDYQKTESPLMVYVNNSSGFLQINNQQGIKYVKIYSLTGANIKILNCDENSAEVCLNDLRKGVYIVTVTDRNQKIFSRKFVKN
jgi:hypothetical protein